MAKKKSPKTEAGKLKKAGMLLSQFVRDIALEKTQLEKNIDGEDKMVSKAEALARLILEANIQYAIIVHADDAEITYLIKWKVDSAGSYTGGVLSLSNDGGSSWQEYSNDEYDGTFREYGDTVPGILPAIDPSLQSLWGW
ncbi:unnamed protein product [marine sediment metagenome]|uniref:Uncharacterized protein n=1 Tax=marine sediment metagenome TaxID=412755 RepID=X1LIA6_9ZZZZ